jgi:hypothetical protein
VGGDAPRAYWQDVFKTNDEQAPTTLVWRPDVDDAATMLERGYDVRQWIMQGLRMAIHQMYNRELGSVTKHNDDDLLEDIYAALDAGHIDQARKLAFLHYDPEGVLQFIRSWVILARAAKREAAREEQASLTHQHAEEHTL